LLSVGFDVNTRDEEQWTAVHIAASRSLYDIVKEIIDRHPDLSAITTTGDTALGLVIHAGADSSLVGLLQHKPI
jgi:ankyrin repeat protein